MQIKTFFESHHYTQKTKGIHLENAREQILIFVWAF